MPQQHSIFLDDITFRVFTEAPSAGDIRGIVLFLHGQAATTEMYKLDPRPFVANRFLFAYFDQRGTGETGGAYTYLGAVRDGYRISALLAERFDLDALAPPFLIAHSIAAFSVMKVFSEDGTRPRALAAVCPALTTDIFRHNANYIFDDGQTGLDKWLEQFNSDPETLEHLRRFLSDPEWICHPEQLERSFKGIFTQKSVRWSAMTSTDWEYQIRDWYRTLAGGVDWSRIDFPVITFLPKEDEWIPFDTTREIHRLLGSDIKRLELLDSGGHLQRGNWSAIAKKIAAFFAQLPPREGQS